MGGLWNMLVEKEKALRPGWEGGALAAIVLAVLLCELFLFNYKHWESLLYAPVEDAACSLYGLEAVGDRYEIAEEEAVVEFSGIHRPVAYLSLALEEGQQAEVVVGAVDEANASYLWTPVRVVRGDLAASQYLRLHFGRDVQKLRVVIRGLRGGSISREAVALNPAAPLCFSWPRFLLLAGGICCLYLLRCASPFYRVGTDLTRRGQWLLTAACIALQLLFFHGMLGWNTDALAWPAYMEHHRQYYRLTEALTQGRVDIGEAPALEVVENPYDPWARAAAGLGAGDFKWDHAYYDGSYYVYFGVVPVVFFYLPFYMLTGRHLPHADCIFLLGALLMVGIAYLLWQTVRRWFPGTPYILYLLLCVTMGAASGLGYAVYKPDLYLVPILAGTALAVWGLAFKPETDDMRCAPALTLIGELLDEGATATVYDHVAMDECRRLLGDSVDYASDMYAATVDADALVLLTEWKEFRLPSWAVIARTMRGNTVIDGRNIYRASDMAGTGLRLYPIGSHPDGIELPENHENDSQNA